MYILQKMPVGELVPEAFPEGSHATFLRTLNTVKGCNKMSAAQLEEWDEFAKIAPKSDNVYEYLEEFPEAMQIPFKDLLFGNKEVRLNCFLY